MHTVFTILTSLGLCLAAFADTPATPHPDRPNIVLLMADDLGYGDLAYTGNPVVKTPHLDAMAREAVRFDRFYAAAPVCTPTRVSCLTGRHPARVNMTWAFRGALPREEVTLAEALALSGYATGHFGKWHVGQLSKTVKQTYAAKPVDPRFYAPPWEHGFEECFSVENTVPTYNPTYLTCGEFGSDGYQMVMNRPVSRGQRDGGFVWRDRFWTGPGTFVDEWLEGPLPEILMDRTLGFIRKSRAANRPFLALVWFSTPHTPVVAGPEHRALYPDQAIRAQHWFGSISAMDEQIGRLRSELKELGLAENTIVWFCSDNGPSWVHDLNSAGPFRGKKGSLHEGGIRVPAVLAWPARFKRPRVVDAPVCTSDFLPTLLPLAGQKIPHQFPIDGIDVMPLLDGEKKNRETPLGFQAPVMKSQAKDTKAWAHVSGRQLVWMNDRHKLTSIDDGKSWELYDLREDPGEEKDLATENPRLVGKMRGELEDWLRSCAASSQGFDYQ